MERIDKILYINLDHRTDRRQEFEGECERMEIPAGKVVRVPGILHEEPLVGCAASHVRALRLASALGVGNALICEDDFAFHDDPGIFQQRIAHFFREVVDEGVPWNAVQLAHNVYEAEPYDAVLSIARRVSNAAGYLVNQPMMLRLAQTIEEAIPSLGASKAHWLYANDVVWCRHMQDGRWFLFTEKLGYQRASYSDLSRVFVAERR